MPAKKPKQQLNSMLNGANGISIDDIMTIDVSDPINSTIDIGTVTIPNYSTTISGGSVWSTAYSNYSNYTIATGASDGIVNISSDGINMKEDTDIKIGERSLKDFMNQVEEQLAILRPAPELEAKWNQLKALRNQYEALKADILEKEKIMKILKD
jgi:hypothetical protein